MNENEGMKGDSNEEIRQNQPFAHFKRLRDRPTDQLTNRRTDGRTDGRTNRRTDGTDGYDLL